MLDAIARIETLTAGKSFEDYVGGSRSAKRFLTPFPRSAKRFLTPFPHLFRH
jgi:hypothetical protein